MTALFLPTSSDLSYYNSDAVNVRLQVCIYSSTLSLPQCIYRHASPYTHTHTHTQTIKDTFSNLRQQSDDRRQRIEAAIEQQQKLDGLRLDFAKQAAVSVLMAAHWIYISSTSSPGLQQLDGEHPG